MKTYMSLHCGTKLTFENMEGEIEVANKPSIIIYGMCTFQLDIQQISFTVNTIVCDLNVPALLGTNAIGDDDSQKPYLLDVKNGTLVRAGFNTVVLHRKDTPVCNFYRSPSLGRING